MSTPAAIAAPRTDSHAGNTQGTPFEKLSVAPVQRSLVRIRATSKRSAQALLATWRDSRGTELFRRSSAPSPETPGGRRCATPPRDRRRRKELATDAITVAECSRTQTASLSRSPIEAQGGK